VYRTTYSWPQHYLKVSGQLHAAAAPRGKSPWYPLDKGSHTHTHYVTVSLTLWNRLLLYIPSSLMLRSSCILPTRYMYQLRPNILSRVYGSMTNNNGFGLDDRIYWLKRTSSKASVNFYETTRCHTSEDSSLYSHRHESPYVQHPVLTNTFAYSTIIMLNFLHRFQPDKTYAWTELWAGF
jgi:hypothetical protein